MKHLYRAFAQLAKLRQMLLINLRFPLSVFTFPPLIPTVRDTSETRCPGNDSIGFTFVDFVR